MRRYVLFIAADGALLPMVCAVLFLHKGVVDFCVCGGTIITLMPMLSRVIFPSRAVAVFELRNSLLCGGLAVIADGAECTAHNALSGTGRVLVGYVSAGVVRRHCNFRACFQLYVADLAVCIARVALCDAGGVFGVLYNRVRVARLDLSRIAFPIICSFISLNQIARNIDLSGAALNWAIVKGTIC